MFTDRNNIDKDDKILRKYENSIIKLKDIKRKTENLCIYKDKEEYYKFINHTAKFLIYLSELEKKLNDEYFSNNTLKELTSQNNFLLKELFPQNYKTSYANPEYTVKIMGDKIGQLFSHIYTLAINNIDNAYKHKLFKMLRCNLIIIEYFKLIENNSLEYEKLLKIYRKFKLNNLVSDAEEYFFENMSIDYKFYNDIVEKENIKDLRYLFRYGKYVSQNEIKTAKFLSQYSKEELEGLADNIAASYVRGFKVDNKDITKRSVVRIAYNLGQERIIKYLIKSIEAKGLTVIANKADSTSINRQYEYDHKFDCALLLDEEYIRLKKTAYREAANKCKQFLLDFSGVIGVEKFGEKPFSPKTKSERLTLNNRQMQLKFTIENEEIKILDEHCPELETSFCIIALPSPEIGENFKQIFRDFVKVNMLDNEKYEQIQQIMIDILDQGEYVHIKGKGQNLTNIKVKLNELDNPDKETNFNNCVSDVNMPIGEVFTTPVLQGTNGMLHVEQIYLDDFKYIDLKLTFKNGYITEYTCKNFKNENDNKDYIKENLLLPHETLPLGEFAIGTNTFAYATAKKYRIMDKLPILIMEKTGPHFAIGDTCFSWMEDNEFYNLLNNKEIVAKDNEKSIIRKEDTEKAYTNCHTDITLPYDSLERISAIKSNGEEIDIIKDGKFVLKGTEELNKSLLEVEV